MGKKIIYFKCHHCGYCCTDVVCCPTPYDIINIVKKTNINPKEFLEFITSDEIEGIKKSDPTWLKINGKKYLMTIKRTKDGCFFRDKQRGICKIYLHRPLLCRLFPFKVRETKSGKIHSFSLHRDIECPEYRDGVVNVKELTEILKEEYQNQEDYQDLVQFFNNQPHNNKKPFDFVDLFVEIIDNKKKKNNKS